MIRDDTPPDALPSGEGPALAEEPLLPEPAPQEGLFGLTLRELIITGAWLLAFALSFFPIAATPFGGGVPVWGMDGQWVLTVGVPTVAVFLLVLRRFSPEGIRRVGSLAIDQFASVAFSVGAVSWAVMLWQQMHLATATGVSPLSTWVTWAETVLLLALVVLTVFAPLVPRIKEDFAGRTETLAHRNANPVRAVVPRPTPTLSDGAPADEPDAETGADRTDSDAVSHPDAARREDVDVPVAPFSSFAHAAGGAFGTAVVADDADGGPRYARRGAAEHSLPGAGEASEAGERGASQLLLGEGHHDGADSNAVTAVFDASGEDLVSATVGEREDDVQTSTHQAYGERDAAQPFWALAPERRPIHDEHGTTIFEIGPEEWVLVLEDRGGAFVVRHEDGRVGFLHDTMDMTRG